MEDADGEWQWGKASSTARALAQLEAHLRCPICGDVLNIPILLRGCGHSFCSGCIRKSLGFAQHCPTCRAPAGLADIQKNPVLEAVVQCFSSSRPAMLAEVTAIGAPVSSSQEKVRTVGPFTPSCPLHLYLLCSMGRRRVSARN